MNINRRPIDPGNLASISEFTFPTGNEGPLAFSEFKFPTGKEDPLTFLLENQDADRFFVQFHLPDPGKGVPVNIKVGSMNIGSTQVLPLSSRDATMVDLSTLSVAVSGLKLSARI